ncbi:acyl-CoA dehydrogenase [Subsaximicrobium wynnwilliamsii]|uniref:Acyl-CoA dehydrogenase n=1 Tax=Subsaximicrobium wynnwilliamsii TaxID=291179 RepID=A0A5C6ZN75_9FLAO|nr:acyl-CoA dehydrogenase family protein [Subsaximicrobium wynnwilliamsii]TXD85257.1 acyl-CoA dehydrogenase [Subsaximicrobium wynnwilliamsii]TXD91299.1 acyl-CoA dehydrogenase [Subsaximicrobium wynnwilliamsii]TXE04693.1 acyl-CoA dehydrogenase [Subsaximicrobium wynnwilliamsii]
MNFDYSEKSIALQQKLKDFMETNVLPIEKEVELFHKNPDNAWKRWPGLEALKQKAKDAGLWNVFLPASYGDLSPGFSNLEYAPLAEIMGRIIWCSEIFNCSAPDTGNMEVLAKYGTPEQQEKWLKPLMNGDIRSAFLMTEPEVASSDATNIETSIIADGNDYVINGRKWWSSGAMDPNCKIAIVMGKTDFDAPRHVQQSMILVPMDTPGLKIERALSVFGYTDSPEGHAEITLENVRVPKTNLLLGEGRGFEIAQGRLGPGRIHHCMRLIGMAQRSLEIMSERTVQRKPFGRTLDTYSSVRQDIALSACEIEQTRLLVLSAADKMDKLGNKEAKDLIAMIKIVTPQMALRVIDRAIQILGGKGVGSDTPLAHFFAAARSLRLADGPDEVHMSQLGKSTINKYVKSSDV